MKMTVEYTNFAESKDVITFINPKLEKKSTLGKCFIFSQEKFFLYFGKVELLYYRKLLNPKLKKLRKILHRKFFLYFLSEKKLNKTFLYFWWNSLKETGETGRLSNLCYFFPAQASRFLISFSRLMGHHATPYVTTLISIFCDLQDTMPQKMYPKDVLLPTFLAFLELIYQ